MDKEKVNINKVINTIESANNGELFHALFNGDIERVNNNTEAACKSVINTLAWWLAGDTDAVATVFASSPLAEKCTNAGALILKACNKGGGFAGACSFYGDEDEEIFKNTREQKKKSDYLRIADVENWLKNHNVTARFNLMSQSAEVFGYSERPLQAGNILNTLPTIIADELQDSYKGVSAEKIFSMLSVIVEGNAYHPVIDRLSSVTWDGVDRFPALWKLLGLEDGEDPNIAFSRVLFIKWMKQSLAMLHNGENGRTYGAEGVLTLNGKQGIGKTTLLRCLAIDRDFFREGQRLDDKDKDTARRCVTTWVAELGELDCTLKSDLGYLKAFITADIDSYRLPYGRTDITAPRRASLAASVNGDSYLVDPTGNRRFWTIKLETIDVQGVLAFDFLQLWKQVEAEITAQELSTCYRLTKDELTQLEERNSGVRRGIKGEAEVSDILLTGANAEWMTVSRFKDLFPVLRQYTVEQVGRVLKAIGTPSKKKKVNGTPVKCYHLPTETMKYIPDRDVVNIETEETTEDIPF